jgi:hypothetical protein
MGSEAGVPAVADPTMMRVGIEDTDSVLKLIGNERKENQMKFRPAAVYSQIHILHRPLVSVVIGSSETTHGRRL